MNGIKCHSDGEGGADIIDVDGKHYYADAPALHEISAKISEEGYSTQDALRWWITGQLEPIDEDN